MHVRFHAGRKERKVAEGFTLIELLIVIAIIGILASLLLPALNRAKDAAKTAQCRSNVRQMTLASAMYLQDFALYLPYSFWRLTEMNVEHGFWFDALRPYTASDWLDPLYRCPAYRGPTARTIDEPSISGQPALGSYGYNAIRLNGTTGVPLWEGNRPARPQPQVAESEVLVPANMIELGDSALETFQNGVFGIWYKTRVKKGVTGECYINQWGYWVGDLEVRRELARRHGGSWNIAFCDGHVETIKAEALYAPTDQAARRWNRDHQPHRERFQ